MLKLLDPGDTGAYASVAELFRGFPFHRGHFGSVLLGAAPGRVFAAPGTRPAVAMILPDDGFAYLACAGDPAALVGDIAGLVARLASQGCLELIVAGEFLEERIGDLFGNVARFEVPRLSFLPPLRGEPAAPPPSGMEYRIASCATRLDVVLLRSGAEVGRCGGWIYEGEVETDILVEEGWRGRGIGAGLGRAFLEACFSRGLSPRWTCWADKAESARLAGRLGFREAGSFNVHIHDADEAAVVAPPRS